MLVSFFCCQPVEVPVSFTRSATGCADLVSFSHCQSVCGGIGEEVSRHCFFINDRSGQAPVVVLTVRVRAWIFLDADCAIIFFLFDIIGQWSLALRFYRHLK